MIEDLQNFNNNCRNESSFASANHNDQSLANQYTHFLQDITISTIGNNANDETSASKNSLKKDVVAFNESNEEGVAQEQELFNQKELLEQVQLQQ